MGNSLFRLVAAMGICLAAMSAPLAESKSSCTPDMVELFELCLDEVIPVVRLGCYDNVVQFVVPEKK
jgi:hypothetical protein